MAEPSVFDFLTTDPDVRKLVGRRVFRSRIGDLEERDGPRMPQVVYMEVSAVPDQGACGEGLIAADYQFDLYSTTPEELKPIERAIRRRLVDYSGPMGDVNVAGVICVNAYDAGVEPEPGLYRRTLLLSIWYSEK